MPRGLMKAAVSMFFAILIVSCNKSPVSIIEASPTIGERPLTTTFDGTSSNDPDGSIAGYLWSFPGGDERTGGIVSYTFHTAGEYTVTLTVTDNKGMTADESIEVYSLASVEPIFERLSGRAGDSPADTAVYRAYLQDTILQDIRFIAITDNSGTGGADGELTGFDLDAILLSIVECDTAGCVENMETIIAFDYLAGGTSFTPGAQEPPPDDKLFGTDDTGLNMDNAVATLGVFDGDSSTSRPDGFISMGYGGTLNFTLVQTVSAQGVYLYLGEVGDNSEVYDGDIIVYGIPRQGPDLEVIYLTIIPPQPAVGETFTINALIINSGTSETIPSTARLMVGDDALDVAIPILPPAGEYMLEEQRVLTGSQAVTISVEADANEEVIERSEANNFAATDLILTDCGLQPGTIEALDAARQALASGDTLIDIDGDCLLELTVDWGEEDVIEGMRIDADDDGSDDIFYTYASDGARHWTDFNGDGVYEYDEEILIDPSDPNTVHVTLTEDLSGDGIPETRTTFTVTLTSDTIEVTHWEDPEQDGSYDEIYTSETPRLQPLAEEPSDEQAAWGLGPRAQSDDLGGIEIEKEGPSACNEEQEAVLQWAYERQMDYFGCLDKLGNPTLAYDFLVALATATVTVDCSPTPKPTNPNSCADVDLYEANQSRTSPTGPKIPITTYPPGWDPDSGCPSIKDLLFHEILHYVMNQGHGTDSLNDPRDRVFGCTWFCGGKPEGEGQHSSYYCAQCLGTTMDDPACSGLEFVDYCLYDVPAVCTCDWEMFPSEFECAVSCPSGLACFWATCEPVGPCAR